MKHLRYHGLRVFFIIAIVALTFAPSQVQAASASRIRSDARAALNELYAINPKARAIGRQAVAVLVFPSITKGGFVFAGQIGEGALFTNRGTAGYYRSVAASYGMQAGIQKFGYALFFMDSRALAHLRTQGGWELGTAPSLVVVDRGVSKSLSTTNLKKGIYAFFFNQQGLMGGLGIQGSKITEIRPW